MARFVSRFLVIGFIGLVSFSSCALFHKKSAAEKGKEIQRAKEDEQKRKEAKAFKKAQDHHYSIQSREVRRRLKKHKREAATPFYGPKKRGFWARLFGG